MAENANESSFKNRVLTGTWLLILLVSPILLWILPNDFFDGRQTICPSKLLFDIECMGCGMTRAVMHFHHFDFDDAIYFNRGVFIVYPVLVILWCTWVYKAAKKLGYIKTKSNRI